MFSNFCKKKRLRLPDRDLDEIKQITRILFIDDQEFEVVEILKKSGWYNTKRIEDVDSLDSMEIRDNHIIFVDIQGVGKILKFKEEGLGLIKALKEKYPHKTVIVYSAINEGDRFHKGLSMADDRLSKTADPYEFQTLVEHYSREAFSLENCIAKLQKLLKSEFGISSSYQEIEKKVLDIYRSGKFDDKYIGKKFDLKDASAIAGIIRLFLQVVSFAAK